MERRKFLIGAGALASGSAAAVGTGAFSSTSIDRTVSVNVADDSSAYVGFNPNSGKHSNFASTDGGGELQIALDGDGSQTGSGINEDSNYSILEVAEVTNQGDEAAFFWVPPKSVTIGGSTVYDDDADDYIDPQATGVPGGGGGSLTGVYTDRVNGSFDDEGAVNAFDVIFESQANENGQPSGSAMFTIAPGNSFYLGFSLNEDGDGSFGDVEMTLRADSRSV